MGTTSQTDSSVSSSATSSADKKQKCFPCCVCYEGYDLETGLKSVGPGWASLVRQAFEKKFPDCLIVQVKEKFGGLRIYAEGPEWTPEYGHFLADLERQSFLICEQCGGPGLRRHFNWIQTLCNECTQKYIDTYKEEYGTEPQQNRSSAW